MRALSWFLVALPALLFVYAYGMYPVLLRLFVALRPRKKAKTALREWPSVSISLPAYNERERICGTLEALLALDYPSEKIEIVVVSDASTDGTDEVVREFSARGVKLVRLPKRGGKTAAENAVASQLRGDIVVNTDASIHIPSRSLKPLIRAFSDPSVGVASGRDMSVRDDVSASNSGETSYVGYEMWVRSAESEVAGIVGASGCFYGIRAGLHRSPLPEELSRDFASTLIAREHGYRSVSVRDAVACVRRTRSLRAEFRRKARTMARGLETLWYKRHLLNPFRYGLFAWQLFSHKLCRWLVPLTLPLGVSGLVFLSFRWPLARAFVALGFVAFGVGWLGVIWSERRRVPLLASLCAYLIVGTLAGVLAWLQVLVGRSSPVWEPTPRSGGRV